MKTFWRDPKCKTATISVEIRLGDWSIENSKNNDIEMLFSPKHPLGVLEAFFFLPNKEE